MRSVSPGLPCCRLGLDGPDLCWFEMRPFLSVMAWATALAVLLAWGLSTFVAERTVPTLLLTYFGLPQLGLLPALPLLAWSVWKRDGRAVAGSVVAVALVLAAMGPQVGGRSDGPRTLRLMTYNIARGEGGAAALAATVSAQNPDVLCLQETNTLTPGTLSELGRRLPGYVAVRSREVAVLTRLPVLARQESALPGSARRLLYVRLKVGARDIGVLGAHFTTIPLRGGWQEARSNRSAQLQALLGAAGRVPGPLLVCGDFNTPARGLVYARLKKVFGNAFEEAGQGFGYTFPSGVPLARIDHVWLRGARATRAAVPVSRASDHRPLVVDVALP